MAYRGLLLRLRPHHEPRGVAQGHQRQAEGFAQAHETCGLVPGRGVDGAAQHRRVVGQQAKGPAFDADQRGNQPRGELPAQLQHAVAVGQGLDDPADVVDPQAVFRNQMPQLTLVGAVPVLERPLEIAQVLFGHLHGLGFVGHQHVDHSVGALYRHRAHLFRGEAAQAAAFDHRRAGHADGGVPGGDDQVAAAEQGGIAGKAAPRGDAHRGHPAGQPGHGGEGMAIQAGDPDKVAVAGPATAAFGKQHHRQPPFLGQAQQAVGLLVVHHPLGAGEHRVVVGQGQATGVLAVEQPGIHRTYASHQPIRRAQGLQLLDAAPTPLGGQGHGAVLHETARVQQVLEVLPGGALAVAATLGQRLRTLGILQQGMAFADFGQVGANQCQVQLLFAVLALVGKLRRLQKEQGLAFAQCLANLDGQGPDDTAALRLDLELHLHRFQHRNPLANPQLITHGHFQAHQHPGARGVQRRRARGRLDIAASALRSGGLPGKEHRPVLPGAILQQLGPMGFDEPGVHLIVQHRRLAQQVQQQPQVARHALQAKLAKPTIGPAQGRGKIRTLGDQLGQQRVIAGVHRVTGIAVAVDPQPGPAGGFIGTEGAGHRPHAAIGQGLFQVDPRLHGKLEALVAGSGPGWPGRRPRQGAVGCAAGRRR